MIGREGSGPKGRVYMTDRRTGGNTLRIVPSTRGLGGETEECTTTVNEWQNNPIVTDPEGLCILA